MILGEEGEELTITCRNNLGKFGKFERKEIFFNSRKI